MSEQFLMKYFLSCYNACESSLKQFKLESTSFWQYVDCKVFNASIHWKHKNILKTTFWVYVNSDLIIYFRIKDRTFLQYDRKLSIKIVNFQSWSYTLLFMSVYLPIETSTDMIRIIWNLYMVRIGSIRSVVRIFDSRLYLVCIFIYVRYEVRNPLWADNY